MPKNGSKPSCARKPLRESCKAISAPRDGQEGCSEARDQCPVGLCGVRYGETCYRYQAMLDGENALVADWLLKRRLTNAGVLERTAEYGDRRNTSNPAATGRITFYSNGRLKMG